MKQFSSLICELHREQKKSRNASEYENRRADELEVFEAKLSELRECIHAEGLSWMPHDIGVRYSRYSPIEIWMNSCTITVSFFVGDDEIRTAWRTMDDSFELWGGYLPNKNWVARPHKLSAKDFVEQLVSSFAKEAK